MESARKSETKFAEEKGEVQPVSIYSEEESIEDVHDPLNWPTIQKIALLMAMNIWIFIGPANILIK